MATALAPASSRAQEPVPSAPAAGDKSIDPEAKRLADRGLAHYEAGRYAAAIDDFEASYRITPASGLLYNLAQAQRLKGDCAAALATYRRFLAEDPTGNIRRLAEARVAEMETCASRRVSDVPPPPRRETEARPVASPSSPASLSSTSSAEAPRLGSRWRRWAGAGFGAAAVAAGIASANFGWHASQASDDVTAIYDRGGTWGPYAMAREQSGRNDERAALWLGIGALASAAVSLWFFLRR